MRKIVLKKDKARKQKRNNLIIGIVLVIVMFASVFGIVANSFGTNEDKGFIEYGSYKFVKQNNYWGLNLGEFSFLFKHTPFEAENVSIEMQGFNLLPSYQGKPLYLDSKDSVSTSEIYQNLGPFVQRIQQACFQEEGCPEDLPIKNCTENFIIISQGENERLLQEDNCVFIESTYQKLPVLTDKFLYKVLGIM